MDIYKELGLDSPDEGQSKEPEKITLVDPETGKTVTFANVDEANAAVANLHKNMLARQQELQNKLASMGQQGATGAVKKDEKVDTGLSAEEEALFDSLNKTNPLKAFQFLVSKSPEVIEMKRQLEEARQREAAYTNSIRVAQVVNSRPELNPEMNPKAGEVSGMVAEALRLMGTANPNEAQLHAAIALVKERKPELFTEMRGRGEQFAPPYQQQGQQGPAGFPVPPRTGSGDYGAPNSTSLLDMAYKQGGVAKMDEVFKKMVEQNKGDVWI